MKITVFYFSLTGHTKQMAEIIAKAMEEVEGVTAKALSIDEADDPFAAESQAIVFGTPVYMASVCHQIHTFLQTKARAVAAGKLCGAIATEDYVHGGGETAIQEILTYCLVMGCLVYSGGGAYGAPVIHLGPVATSKDLEKYEETFRIYGRRMASKALELYSK